MSWLARSIANSLRLDPDGDSDEDDRDRESRDGSQPPAAPYAGIPLGDNDEEEEEATQTQGRSVKEDLSELTQTLTRQLWGVASFLAPPPQSLPDTSASPDSPPWMSTSTRGPLQSGPASLSDRSDSAEDPVDSPRVAGIRSDFAEIGGRFRSGISRLSSNKAVSEISKIASTFLPFVAEDDFEDEDEELYGSGGGAIGVTDEVLAFARNISMHPETWLDFPLLPDEDESDDFDMSYAQQEHALAVEHLAPRLAALRIELCPSHMSDGCFWKIYFVLLHPRLNKEDAERLSTPQIVEARAMLLQELQNRTKAESDRLGRSTSYRKESASSTPSSEQHVAAPSGAFDDSTLVKTQAFEETIPSITTSEFETEKHPVMTEIKIVDKSVIEVQLNQAQNLSSDASKVPVDRYEDDGDDWLQEDDDDTNQPGVSRVTSIPIGNDEDVSFSDLEEEDDRSTETSSKTVIQTFCSQTSTKESADWVQLQKSSSDPEKDGKFGSTDTKESSEWLDVDDIDVV